MKNYHKKVSMVLDLTCDICDQNVWSVKSPNLIECDICGLIRANKKYSAEELASVYNGDYFFGEEYIDYIQDRKALEKNFKKRIRRLIIWAQLSKDKTLVEIGCAYGFFLNAVRSFVKRSIGFDVSRDGISYAQNKLYLEAYNKDFRDHQLENVDVVCLWDVIEHVPDPDSVIRHVASILSPGGHVAITTGDIGSVIARIQGDNWRMIHPPTHLFYFNKKTMMKLLQKHGFKVIYFGHMTVYRNIGSVFVQIINKRKQGGRYTGHLNALYAIARFCGLTRINFGINLYDIMEVIAKKESNKGALGE